MASSSSKKRKTVRNYHKDFLLLGFYPSTTDSEKPECVECGLIMTNDSMKKSKLLAHQQLKHPSCVGKELSYFEKKVELRQKHAPKTLDFLWEKARDDNRKALKVSYIVSEMIAKVGKPHTIAESLVKPAMLICAHELLGEQAANTLKNIPLSNDTVKRRQDEMAENLEEQLVEKLKVSKFSLQIDETTINNSVLLLAYVRYIDAMVIHEEMLFINKLIDTRSETIYAAVYNFLHDNGIPLSNLLQIATDGASAMTGKHNGFVAKFKEVAPHIMTIHCIIHRQHLAAKSLDNEMEEALKVAIAAINFVKANALHDRLFQKLCEDQHHQTLLLHTEVRWLSKGNSLVRLAELWDTVLIFVHHMETSAHSKKQKDKAEALFLELSKSNTKAKIFYLADIFKHVNQLNKTLQGQNTNLVECAEKVHSFLNKLSLWKMHLQKNEFAFFCNLAETAPSLEVIASCTNHLQNLRDDMTRRFKDIIEMSPPGWIIDIAHFDVLSEENVDPIIAGEILELKENKALMANIERNGLIGWLSVGSFYPLLFEKVIPFLLGFPTTWLVEAGFSAVNDLLTKKRSQLQIEKRGELRLRLNQGLAVQLDKLIKRHKD